MSQLQIDGVFCISRRGRTDRRELLVREFEGSGLNIEFLIVARDNESPERGCFDSHIKCARMALERNYRRILVLEDDATLPITGYYPALIVCTAVTSWVWVVVAWVGMKYFRHAKVGVDG